MRRRGGRAAGVVALLLAAAVALGSAKVGAQKAGAQFEAAGELSWLRQEQRLKFTALTFSTGRHCVAKLSTFVEGAHTQRTLLTLPKGKRFVLVSVSTNATAPRESRVAVVTNGTTGISHAAEPLFANGTADAQGRDIWWGWLDGNHDASVLAAALPETFASTLLLRDPGTAGSVSFWTRKLRGDTIEHFLVTSADANQLCPDLAIGVVGRIVEKDPEKVASNYAPSGIQGPAPVWPLATKDAEIAMAKRSVRIEFVKRNEQLGYCTGLLLDSRHVLTARHCVDHCVRARTEAVCSSYSIDIDYFFTRSPTTAASLGAVPRAEPVVVSPSAFQRARRRPPRDYAVLLLNAAVSNSAPVIRSVEEPTVVGSPGGYPTLLARGQRFSDDYDGDDGKRVLHTCFTDEGTSGAPMWEPVGTITKPTGIHVQHLRPCFTSSIHMTDWIDREARAKQAKEKWYSDYLALKDQQRCIGQVVPLGDIYEQECPLTGHSQSSSCPGIAAILEK